MQKIVKFYEILSRVWGIELHIVHVSLKKPFEIYKIDTKIYIAKNILRTDDQGIQRRAIEWCFFRGLNK